MPDARTCCTCKTEKSLDQFNAGQSKCKPCARAYNREWSRANRDRLNELARRSYREDPEVRAKRLAASRAQRERAKVDPALAERRRVHTMAYRHSASGKAARHEQAQRARARKTAALREQRESAAKVRAARAGLAQLTRGAKRRGYAVTITADDFATIVVQPCTYCGRAGPSGIDRVDNSVGYELGNCAPCCLTCNRMKSTATVQRFIDHCRRIVAHFSQPQRSP